MTFTGHGLQVPLHQFPLGGDRNRLPRMALRDQSRWNELELQLDLFRKRRMIVLEIGHLRSQSMSHPYYSCITNASALPNKSFIYFFNFRPGVSQPTATHSTTMKKPASSGALSSKSYLF